MRKSISKKTREAVYNKYQGHCAYCGCELEYKDMQVDHVESVYCAEYHGKEVDDSINNYMPACRSCNFYKGTSTIEQFRAKIEKSLIKKLHNDFNYKMLLKYGLIKEDFKQIQFYFEQE